MILFFNYFVICSLDLLKVQDSLSSGSYKLHVHGTGHGLNFHNKTDLICESKSVSIFIQTDKAMYKPGQTGSILLIVYFIHDYNDGPSCSKLTMSLGNVSLKL